MRIACLLLLLLSPGYARSSCATFGDSNTGAGREGNGQRYYLVPVNIASDSTLSNFQLNVYGTAIAGNMVGLLYKDDGYGDPGALLAQSPPQAAFSGVNTIPMAMDLPAGNYWYGVWKENGTMEFWHELSGSSSRQSQNYATPVFPPNFVDNGNGFPGTHIALNFCDAAAPFTPTPTFTPPATGGLCGNYGTDTLGGSGSPATTDFLYGQQIYFPTTGSTTSLNFYLSSGSGQVELALYNGDVNIPTTLIETTGPQTPSLGWNRYPIGLHGLVPGYYWVVMNTTGPINFDLSSGGQLKYRSQPFGTMPGGFNPQGTISGFSFAAFLEACGVDGTATLTRTYSFTSTATKTITQTLTETPVVSATPTATPSSTRSPTKTTTPTITLTPIPACFTLGTTATGTGGAYLGAGEYFAQKLTLNLPGRLTNISFRISGSAIFHTRVALYADDAGFNRPGALLLQSASQNVVSGWNNFAVGPIDLTVGTYWLGMQIENNSGTTTAQYTAGGGLEYHVYNGTGVYGAFPDPMQTGGGTSTNTYAIYADLCDPSMYTATSTPTPSLTPGACNVLGNNSGVGVAQAANGAVNATRFDLIWGGRFNSINAYFNGGAGNSARFAVYDNDPVNGRPGNLINQSASTVISSLGFFSIPFPTTDLAIGTYWLAIQTNAAGLQVPVKAASGTTYNFTQGYTTFPALAPAGGAGTTQLFAIYADVCDPAQYTATPTTSPTRTATSSATVSFTRSPTPSVTDSFTSSPTRSPSLTPTVTKTATSTSTPTSSFSVTKTQTPTYSPTASFSFSPTLSSSATLTATRTATPTPSLTVSVTASKTSSPTPTFSSTRSFTVTLTGTPTHSPTLTPTPTVSPSNTSNASATASPTVTDSFSPSPTPTQSPTYSDSPTPTDSYTDSPTPSATPTLSESATASPSSTPSQTPSATPSQTQSETPSVTSTETLSSSPSPTWTATPSITDSFTASPTASDTPIASATITPTATPTPSVTKTASPTPSFTATPTATKTASPTATPSATPSCSVTPSATPTASPSPTESATPSVTKTASPSATETATPTVSVTPSATRTSSPTPTETLTLTQSATITVTPTITVTFSESPSFTQSPTITKTPTITLTWTPSNTPLPGGSPKPDSAQIGPVPAGLGQNLTVGYNKAATAVCGSIYMFAGPKVYSFCYGPSSNARSVNIPAPKNWPTVPATGYFMVNFNIKYADGTTDTTTQKFVIVQ